MIYDCTLLFNDVELLELRFMTLYEMVDYFVIVEAGESHIGEKKLFYWEEFQSLFAPYADKVIYVKVDSMPFDNPRENEYYQRNLIVKGLINASPEDYIIIGDIDEIANPEALREGIAMKYDQFGLNQKLFYYYVNCIANENWWGSMVWKRKYIISPQEVRFKRGNYPYGIDNGGWHYSFLGGLEKIKLKLHSFSEQQVNTPDVNNDENILRCLNTGEDIFHRTEDKTKKRFLRMDELDHPQLKQWLIKYPHNFRYDT